jgi:hypothetical protein
MHDSQIGTCLLVVSSFARMTSQSSGYRDGRKAAAQDIEAENTVLKARDFSRTSFNRSFLTSVSYSMA